MALAIPKGSKGKTESINISYHLLQSLKQQQLLKMKHSSRLPDKLVLECLARLPNKSRYKASLVCSKWLELLESRDFYLLRKQLGHINHLACLLQSKPPSCFSDLSLPENLIFRSLSHPTPSQINVFNPVSRVCKILPPLPHPIDDDFEIVSSQGKLILMKYAVHWKCQLGNPLYVFEFATGRWWQGKSLPICRLHFTIAASDDCRVFVAGGTSGTFPHFRGSHSAWMYDVRKDEWSELPPTTCSVGVSHGRLIGNQFMVATLDLAYCKKRIEMYNFELQEWKQVESEQLCLYSRPYEFYFGFKADDQVLSRCSSNDWRGRFKVCKLPLGDRSLIITYKKEDDIISGITSLSIQEEDKFDKIEVPHQIFGDVHSMCCVEVP
ncbi:F-box/kelch-repeat protein At2g44130-like [Impatiens glandulifera]|uniref:F-box/kelch-repeat protein At2g44130-like n=1 Tax=Impatiens glandulifera TaxID=253017 RepID=UPI001FB0F716|nr:F-box/kelch-repeat protein At2g44130-like [Impatiens glandulifera]